MMFDSQTQPEPPRRLRYPAMVELIILGLLIGVLMIGLAMIRSLVSERSRRAQSVRAEIASSWGQAQTIAGPVLIVPYRVRDSLGRHVTTTRARFLPDKLKTTGPLHPERRHRGIFETILYRADLTVEGAFSRPDFSAWNIPAEDILWNEAVVTVGISDLRGIRGNPTLRWNARDIAFSGGSGDAKLWRSGLTAAVPFAPNGGDAATIPFSFALLLNGSEEIRFLPLGRETIVELAASWPDPSFAGAYLPETRSVTSTGFTARWSISSLARSYPQQWRDQLEEEENRNALGAVAASAFGVDLMSPVGHYQKTERSMKYGALFILLTFLTFFLYELLSPVTLHPVQYFLVGGALCLFYLLLLSISEHGPFVLAYVIGSMATIALISSYSAAILRSRMRVLGLAGFLVLLYGYLYVLLQLEDWALLMGSIGLFLILALVMYTTRRVDWGAAHLGPVREAEG